MTDFTTEEIEAALYGYDPEDDDEGSAENTREVLEYGETWRDKPLTISLRGEIVPIERLDGKSPCEGGGEDVWYVFKVGDQTFRKVGCYTSHYGTDWDGAMTEVKPVEKTVTVYETV